MQNRQPGQASWQAGKVSLDGLMIHYTRTGGDKPPLVLSHGITDDGLCWTPVTQALESEYDVIMVDARGHGRSDGCTTGYGPLEQAADLAGVIAALGLQKPILMGHSMGAATTLVLTGLHPDVPRAIILEDPPDWWVGARTGEQEEAYRQGRVNWMSGLKGKSRQQLIDEEHIRSPLWSGAELGPWADAKMRFDLDALSLLTSNPAAQVDYRKILPQITCPALLLAADNDRGAIVSPASASALQAMVPQLEVVHIPGAGHNIRREQFESYLAAVRAFLSGLGA